MHPVRILATVKPGKEEKVKRDILDALYPFDPQVNVQFTGFGGVLIIETKLKPKRLIGLLSWRRIRHLYRLIPLKIMVSIENVDSKTLSAALNDISEGEATAVIVKKRGIPSPKAYEIVDKIIGLLKTRNIHLTNRRKASKIVFIEFMGEILGVGVLDERTFKFIKEHVSNSHNVDR
ncbi:MAG: hypothetical protein DRJ47_00970 [Thermoprotei archaeon]|nr:MAG: hypothetical protein DRJ47_00970 [Thermoprotei archaeon]